MPQKIPARNFDYHRQTMVLGDLRYGITLRWNEACQQWAYAIDIDGQIVKGFEFLVEGQIVANAQPCLPWSFGGLYLERVDTNTTGMDALIDGSLCLWFFHSFEIYQLYGSTRI